MEKNAGNEVTLLPCYWNRKRIPNTFLNMVMANEVVAMVSTNSEGEIIHDNIEIFDSDSDKVGIYNRCSACISHDKNDFEGPVTKVNQSIKGFGGERVTNVYKGTIV